MPNSLPRLLYLGDVPVESTCHGSALVFRLLRQYPPDKLRIVESGPHLSDPTRRLPGIQYADFAICSGDWLNTRFHRWISTCLLLRARNRANSVSGVLRGFRPEAVLTIAHGHGLLTAVRYAEKRGLPFHLIAHDDWFRTVQLPKTVANVLDRQFAKFYRRATSRLCVSPFMRERYYQRYGSDGTVLLPLRAVDCPTFTSPPDRLVNDDRPFTVAFAGSVNSPAYMQALVTLALVLESLEGRLVIFGPHKKTDLKQAGLLRPNVEFLGLMTSNELIARLRDDVDALYLPMSFEPRDRVNMEISFPSKLTDYTSVGLPILIYGPEYCSAARWAREARGVAEIVTEQNPEKLMVALKRLVNDAQHRRRLGQNALENGKKHFAYDVVFGEFCRALAI